MFFRPPIIQCPRVDFTRGTYVIFPSAPVHLLIPHAGAHRATLSSTAVQVNFFWIIVTPFLKQQFNQLILFCIQRFTLVAYSQTGCKRSGKRSAHYFEGVRERGLRWRAAVLALCIRRTSFNAAVGILAR